LQTCLDLTGYCEFNENSAHAQAAFHGDHCLITALAAGGLTSCSGTPAGSHVASATPGQPVPAAATATVKRLVSGSEAQQWAALSPGLAAVLPTGAVFPAGSALALDSDS
jgi:hypothetical protein